MSQTVRPQQTQTTPTVPQPAAQPAVIATRQHCEADGVGLSHYILMDRKPAQ
ncbi:MAG: modified peptide precursor CbpA [Betaproteobacteria bacterium]|nr:modified peptide precursor CbpA [Betaproteobacteria bacterium]